jgi:hypothetical protein
LDEAEYSDKVEEADEAHKADVEDADINPSRSSALIFSPFTK